MLKAILPVDVQSFIDGNSFRTGVYLNEPIKPSSKLTRLLGVDRCEGSSSMVISGLQVHTGDIIFCRDSDAFSVFKVLGCATAPGFPPHAIGLKHSRSGDCTWRLQAGDDTVATAIFHEDILAVAVWTPVGASDIRVLMPTVLAYYHPDAV